MYLGVDIGGTFTDLVLMNDDGVVSTAKALTTPGDLETGVFNAIALVAESEGMSPEELLGRVVSFGHGTTQATNALIERKGAVTGLITTRGFGDTIGLQRLMGFTSAMTVDELGWYSKRKYPDPIIPRELRREIPERVDCVGEILLPLDEAAVRQAVSELTDLGVDTFAVTFLWSFRNSAHERRAAEIIAEMRPDAFVSLSCEIAPIIGEYERTAGTALNSYLAPRVVSYLGRMEGLLRDRGYTGSFNILNSSGGVMPAHEAARRPVTLLMSGPTGGVLGSLQLATALGHENVITTDMGGTSFDVGLIVDGKPLVAGTHEAGGYHLNTPVIDIRAIGAGGGSIARVENGLLRVGPESAGAMPGPVCYGRGGKLATVTDADVVLGIISPDNFLGGRMTADKAAAAQAIREQIAEPLGISVEKAAAGIRQVVDSHLADTLREVTIGRGYDPRDFVLFAYGGAGPAHSADLGADLGVPRIVIPATSMAHSAYGALASDIHQSAERSILMRGGGGEAEPSDGLDTAAIGELFDELEAQCRERIEAAGIPADKAEIVRTVDIRYRRQTHDLIVRIAPGPVTADTVRDTVQLFEETYEALYGKGSGFRQAGIELTTFRVEAIGRAMKPVPSWPSNPGSPKPAHRDVYNPDTGKMTPTPVWQWLDLPVDDRVSGPAIIEHPDTTVYVGPRQTAVVDTAGNLTIDLIQVAETSQQASETQSHDEIDPISFEVIRHKLQAITEEQAITLKSVSGSPVVTDATDFNNGLYLEDGSIVTMGPQVIFHTGTMATVIRSIIENFEENPGIREGDMFVLNDPYRGAIHQPDVSIVAPIFANGKRVAWAGSCAHQMDVGGMSFGSWAYGATDVQQEAMLLPGVKIVENGVVREDIWQMIMGMSRLPDVIGLDFKGMIAANNVAINRLGELFERYGVATVEGVMHTEIGASEQRMRARLKSLPDGVYRARDYIDHDGHGNELYRVCLSVEKRGDELTFDLEGTSPQAPGFINCTFSGMKGALLTGLLPILAPDIRWNEGVLRPVTIKAPEATICNAKWPAPVSGATVSAVWIVMNVAVSALSRMVSCAPDLVREAQAVTKGQMSVLTFGGLDRDGEKFGAFLLDSMAGGGGASIDQDGLDGSGDYDVPRPSIANVEANESSSPILYMFRAFVPDTAGAGRMRGGATTGVAITPHGVDGFDATLIGHGVEVPNSTGLFGGMPAACATHLLRRSNLNTAGLLIGYHDARTLMDDPASDDLGAKPGNLRINRGDVFAFTFQGGGGYGDPIRRDPALVLSDIRLGYLSPDWAAELFGVVLDEVDGTVDEAATDARRLAIRTERLGAPPALGASVIPEAAGVPDMSISGNRVQCACGSDLGSAKESWKSNASMRKVTPETCGPHVRLHEALELREFSCPRCATLLELEVCRKDEESLWTVQLD